MAEEKLDVDFDSAKMLQLLRITHSREIVDGKIIVAFHLVMCDDEHKTHICPFRFGGVVPKLAIKFLNKIIPMIPIRKAEAEDMVKAHNPGKALNS